MKSKEKSLERYKSCPPAHFSRWRFQVHFFALRFIFRPGGKTISGGVLNGKAIGKPPPAYPPVAKAVRASGVVMVSVVVDEGGRVIQGQAVSGHPLLRAVCVSAARQARLSPTLLAGKPVKVRGMLTYEFKAE
ncbi:MAG: energy transducer TonB [Acidobacteria bacterium]|nr:energy transducer TonB [Acidobacteriota bacterium]